MYKMKKIQELTNMSTDELKERIQQIEKTCTE